MTRYAWSYQPQDEAPKGKVFLTLHGALHSSKEVLLPPAVSTTGVISGRLTTKAELGDLESGSLRSDDKGLSVQWFRVVNLDDGTSWHADGVECDDDGRCPLLNFEKDRTSDDTKSEGEGDSEDDDTEEGTGGDQPASGGSGTDSSGGSAGSSQAPAGPSRADLQSQIASLPSGLGSLTVGATRPRTYEVYVLHNNNLMPLYRVLQRGPIDPRITKIFVTTNESSGYGVGGDASKWAAALNGVAGGREQLPSKFGLDDLKGGVVASDGFRAWPLSSDFLQTLFGNDWAKAVYG